MRKVSYWIYTCIVALDIVYIAIDNALPWLMSNIADVCHDIKDRFTAT